MAPEHFDVLIVGAGLSGIGAAVHLRKSCPERTYAILEAREAIGGTWDLFRYPGIRSDSDMYTMGYSFRPWTDPKAIADGSSILQYINDTARENGVEKHIRFRHRVKRASWSTPDARWTVEIEKGPNAEIVQLTCNFLFMCSGYYNYDHGYEPPFPGMERFAGRVVHPQKWTSDLDYAGKRVVVIGSGATAVTLVPAMAPCAAHVTMLQRSPTYIVSLPGEDKVATWLNRLLPSRLAYAITRWKNVLLFILFYQFARRSPDRVKRLIIGGVKQAMGPGYDVRKHFTPRYKPWDQRMCLVPDGDLFEAIKSGRASVVTDEIETFTETGIKLRSGDEIAADLVVSATGLDLLVLGGIELAVDGKAVELPQTMSYKGMMFNDVPNIASAIGYTNASWTLKCDLTCKYVCRLLNHMDELGVRQCTPRRNDPTVTEAPWIDFTSGYIQRSLHKFPKQGNKRPWRLYQNYLFDTAMLRFGSVEDGTMEFSNPAGAERRVEAAIEAAA